MLIDLRAEGEMLLDAESDDDMPELELVDLQIAAAAAAAAAEAEAQSMDVDMNDALPNSEGWEDFPVVTGVLQEDGSGAPEQTCTDEQNTFSVSAEMLKYLGLSGYSAADAAACAA